jgi:hypothetical protein
VPVTSSNLTALSAIAGFDVTTLYNSGSLSIPDSQFGSSDLTPADQVARAIITAGVDPVGNGIPLFEALAEAQYDDLSTQTLIQLLFVYARQAGTGSSVPQDVGAAIAGMVRAGTLTATQAVSYVVQAAENAGAVSRLFGTGTPSTTYVSGEVLGSILGQLEGVLGSDPIAAGVQVLAGPLPGLGAEEFSMLIGLGVSNAASIATGLQGMLGSAAQSLTPGDLTLASASTAGADIANAVFRAFGASGGLNFLIGAALIQALGQRHTVDPIPPLVTYTYKLAALIDNAPVKGSETLPQLVAASVTEIVADALVTGATAGTDIANAAIALVAAATTNAQAQLAAEVFGYFVAQTSTSVSTAVGTVASAIGTTLTVAQGLQMLITASGASTLGSSVETAIASALTTLVTNTVVTPAQVVSLLAINDALPLTASYMTSSGLTFAQIVTDLGTATPSQVTAAQALTYIGALIPYVGTTTAANSAIVTLTSSLINNNHITASAAFTDLNTSNTTILFGIMGATSTTAAALVTTYFSLVGSGYISLATGFELSPVTPIVSAQSSGYLSYVQAVELLAVTAGGDDQIFTYITNGDIATSAAFADIIAAVAANGGTVEQQIAELAAVASNTTYNSTFFEYQPNPGLIAAAAQEILTLAEANLLTGAQLGSAFALAYGYEGADSSLVNEGYVIGVLTEIANLSDPNALPLAAAAIASLVYTSGSATAAQPLSPAFAAADISGNYPTSNGAVELLVGVAGALQSPYFDFYAGQEIATGIRYNAFPGYFPTLLDSAVSAGTINAVDAALLLGSVAAQTTNIQSDLQTQDYLTRLGDYATGDANVIPAFGTAIAVNYDPVTAVEALALIGGAAPSVQSAAQSEILTIIRSGAQGLNGDDYIYFLTGIMQLVASSQGYSTESAAFNVTVQTAIASDIAAMISNGFATVTGAVTNVGDYVAAALGSAPGIAANAISLLEYLAANDAEYAGGTIANLEQLAAGAPSGTLSVQAEISFILGANEIGAATAVTTLEALQASVANTSPLYTVVANELSLLDTSGIALEATAAVGTSLSPQQLENQAVAIAELGDNEVTSKVAEQATSSGNDTLSFAAAPVGVVSGLLVLDLTTPGAIAAGTTVASVNNATVTLSGNVAATVNSGDTIAFYQAPAGLAATDSATSSSDVLNFAAAPSGAASGYVVLDLTNPSAIAAGTTVGSSSGGAVTLSASVTVGNGDTIAFFAPGEQQVLTALAANIGNGSTNASPTNAVTLLLDLASVGAADPTNPALADATATLVSLANNGTGGLSIAGVIEDISTALFNGTLSSTAGFSILEAFAALGSNAEPYAQAAISYGLLGGYFTIAQLDAAVTAGGIQPLDAIAALSQAAGGLITDSNSALSVTAVGNEIVTILGNNPGLNTASVLSVLTALAPDGPSLLSLATDDVSASLVAAGYTAINAIVAADTALGQGFFSAILGLTSEFSTFSTIVAPAEVELFGANGLVSTGAVDVNTALTAIVGFPESQQLPLLVMLAGVPSAQSTVLQYINQIVDNPGNTDTYITADTTLAAFATAYGGATSLTTFYEQLLVQLGGENGTGAAAFVTVLQDTDATNAQQLTILSNLIAVFNQIGSPTTDITNLLDDFTTQVNALLIQQGGNASQLAASLGSLYSNGVYTGAQIIGTISDIFSPTSPQEFLTIVADLPAAGMSAAQIAGGIVEAAAQGIIDATQGVDMMLIAGTQSTPALEIAATTAFAAALAQDIATPGSAPIAVDAATNIGAVLSLNAVTAAQAVTFLTQLLLAQPTTSSFVATEINTLVVADDALTGLAAITGMAQALAPIALVAAAATSAATASGDVLDFASVPAGIGEGLSVLDLTHPGAIPDNTEVQSVTGTTVTLSGSVTAASGDTIAFYNPLLTDSAIQGQVTALGAAIATLTGAYGFSALQEAEAILAAVGSSPANLNPDYGVSLVAAFAGQGNSTTQIEAGEAVAALVEAGTISATQAAADLDNSYFVLGATTPAQVVNFAVGLLSGGSASAAAQLVDDILALNQEPIATIAAAFTGAIGTGTDTVTALQIVDVAALLAADSGAFANPAALVAPLLSNSNLSGQQVVAELAAFIGASPGLTAGNFMTLFATIAAGSSTTAQSSMGVGLAGAIAAGDLTFATAAADLQSAIAASTITLNQALTILVGAGASAFGEEAGETIGALITGNATAAQTVATDIETAVANSTLTAAQALTLLAGIVDGGAPAAAAAAASLYGASKISLVDLGNLTGAAVAGSVPQGATAYILATAFPVAAAGIAQQTIAGFLADLINQGNFTLSFSGSVNVGQVEIQGVGSDGVTDAVLGDVVSGPGIPAGATVGSVLSGGAIILAGGVTATQTSFDGTFTVADNAAAVEAQIVAALPPASDLANLVQLLVDLGYAAGPAALGQTLFSIIEGGTVSASAVVAAIQATGLLGPGEYDQTPIFALGGLAQIAALQPSGTYAVDPATIESDAYAAILAMFPPSAGSQFETAAQFVSQGVGALIAEGGVFKAIFLPVLAQLVARDPTDYVTAAGGEFTTLLNSGAITAGDLVAALQGTGLDLSATIVALAAAISPANITAQNQLVFAINDLVPEGPLTETAFQSYVTALQASGLPAVQIVGALAGIANYALDVIGGIPQAIAGMISGGQIIESAAYTVIGQSFQATGFSGTNLAQLIGEVGLALGDSAATLVSRVAGGSYGVTVDSTITQLAYLTGIDLQLSGQLDLDVPSGVYPFIGLTIGAQITGMANAGDIALGQALTDVIQAAGVSNNNKALILVGAAAAGTGAQQVAAGAVLGTFLNSGGQPDLSDATVSGFISLDQAVLLFAGMVETGNAATDATAGTQINDLIQREGILPPGQLAGVLDGAVASGALSVAAAVDTLALVATAGSANGGLIGLGAIRAALAGELVALVNESAATPDAAVAALTVLAGAGSTRLQTEAGRLIAALATANLATPSQLVGDIDSAVAANALTVAQAIVIDTAAALAGPSALATALGTDIGQMIAAGKISVVNGLAAIASSDSTYGVTDATNEVLLLVAVGRANASGLQLAVGQAVGALLNRGVVAVGPTIAALNGAVGDLSAAQAAEVLIGIAATASFQAQTAVGGEFDVLAGTLGRSTVIADLDQAIRATTLSPTQGFAVLVSMAANSTAMVTPVTSEIAGLIAGVVTSDQALAALFAAAGSQDFASTPAATDATIAQIITSLEGMNLVAATQVTQDLDIAAKGTPTVSASHAVGILLALTADAPPSSPAAQGTANELGSLLSSGIGAAALAQDVLNEVAAGTITVATAVTMLIGTVESVSTSAAPATEVTVGSALSALVNNGNPGLTQLFTNLASAVSGGTLGIDREIGLIAELASSLSSSVTASALPLIQLYDTKAATAAQIFADIEAVAAAAGVSYDDGFGLLIADIASTTDLTLQTAVADELASLVSRSLITANQAANYIAEAVSDGLSADTAVLLYAVGIGSTLVAASGIAALVNGRSRPLTSVLADLQAAATAGSLTVDAEIKVIGALANVLTVSGSLSALSGQLTQLVEAKTATAAQVFTDLAAVAQLGGSYSQALGTLLAGIAGSTDTGLQNLVGQQIGSLVAAGSLTTAAALTDIAAALAAGQLTAAQAQSVTLASVANGGPAMQAAVGQLLGGELASQNSAATVGTVMSALTAGLSGGTFTASQLVGILAGIGTVAYTAPDGGTAAAAGPASAETIADGPAFTSPTLAGLNYLASLREGTQFLSEFVSLNQQISQGLNTSLATDDFDDYGFESFFSDTSDYSTLTSDFNTVLIDTVMNDLAAALGGLGNNNPQTQFEALISALGTAPSDAANTLNSFGNSGALAAAVELVSLVTGGRIAAAQAMSAIGAAAPGLPPSRLVYFLAALTAAPSLQVAAPRELAALVGGGVLTATAVIADIAAIINAAPADDGILAAITPATAVSALIGLYAAGTGTSLGPAAAAEIESLLANPPAGYSQAALTAAINAAVTSGELTGSSSAALLAEAAVSAELTPSAALSGIITTISGYVTAGRATGAAVASDILENAGSAANAPFTAGAILDGVLGASPAISAIEGAALTGNQVPLALLGAMAQEDTARPLNSANVTALENAFAAVAVPSGTAGVQLVTAIQSAGLANQQQLTLLIGIAAHADPATAAAIAQALVSIGGGSLYPSDPFFSGALSEAGADFVAVYNGTMTVSAAISDVEQYAPAHNASTDSALSLLYSLFGDAGLSSAAQAVYTEEGNRISDGRFEAELAERVTQGTTSTFNTSGHFVPQATTAISFNAAGSLLSTEMFKFGADPGEAFVQAGQNAESVEQNMLANDLYIDQPLAGIEYNPQQLLGLLDYGYSQYSGYDWPGVPGSYTGGLAYSYDQALEVMATQPLLTPNYYTATIGNGASTAVQDLLQRIINGDSETALVNQVAMDGMNPTQAIAALNQELAVVTASMAPSDAAAISTLAFGWLGLKTTEYQAGDFEYVSQGGNSTNIADPTDAQTKLYLTSNVDNLYAELFGNDLTQAVQGLGAVMELPSASSFDQASAMALFQGLQTDVAANSSSLSQAASDTDPLDLDFTEGFTQEVSVNNAGVIGTVRNELVGNYKNYQAYLDLGSNLFATGVPGAGILANVISGLSSYFPTLAEGNSLAFTQFVSQYGGGLNGQEFQDAGAGDIALGLTVASLACTAICMVTQIGAVANALGPTGILLNGEFAIIGATAGLIPNIVSGLVHAGLDEYEAPIKDIVGAISDLASGNSSGANSFGDQLGDDIFTIESGGFQLNDVAAVGSAAADSFLDLFSGHPQNVVGDLENLGGTIVNLIENNVFFAAVAGAIEQWIQTTGQAVAEIAPILSDWWQWNYDYFHNISFDSSSPPQPQLTSLTDVFSQAQATLDDPGNYLGFVYPAGVENDPNNPSQSGNGTNGPSYTGTGSDGYLVGATVFVDENGTGVLASNDYMTTTNAQGQYTLPVGVTGPIIIEGGTDSATGLPFTGKLSAPAGSISVTPLSTLVQDIAAQNGNNLPAAEQAVDSALGLPTGTDPTQTDPIATTEAGNATGMALYTAGAEVLNTLTMLNSAGATSDPAAALASQIAALPSGTTIDLTDPTTLTALATASGLGSNAASAVSTLAGASNALLLADAASTSDPATLLTDVAAVSNTAQGATSQALQNAQNDPSQLDNVVNAFTGSNLNSQVQNAAGQVGNFSSTPPATPPAPALAASSTVGPAGDGVTNTVTPTIVGTATPNDAVTLYEGSTVLGTATANSNGAYSITVASALLLGSNVLDVTDTSAGGNASAASAGLTIDVVLGAPTIAGTVAGQLSVAGESMRPFSNVAIADPSATSTDTVTITLGGAGGALTGTDLTGGTGGVYTLTDSAAAITGDIEALVFTPASEMPGSTTNFTISDQSSTYPVAVSDATTSVVGAVPAALSGDGLTDTLMVANNTGALVLDEVSGGSAMGYAAIGGLGSEWQFEGDGSFLGDGKDGFLIWNDGANNSPISGALVVGEDVGGVAQYTAVGGIGAEWQFEGTGPLLGQSTDDFLLWDNSTSSPNDDVLVVGSVAGGTAAYTAIGGVGSNWAFEGVGDYLGDGKAGFLMEDQNTGNLVVGEVVNGSAQYSLVGGLGPEWQFEGSGDLLGQGQDDFLIWDGSKSSPGYGALVVGQVTAGSAQYTQIGAVGPEWQFVGVGDYDGASGSEFLMRNSGNGVLVIGTVAATNGAYGVTYAQIGGVGPEWNLHTGNVAALA